MRGRVVQSGGESSKVEESRPKWRRVVQSGGESSKHANQCATPLMQYAPVAQVTAHLSLRQPRSVRYQQPLVSGALLGLLDSIHAQLIHYSWWLSVHACGKSGDFGHAHHCTWPCGLMDKALVFGTKDCRFESCQGHIFGAANWISARCAILAVHKKCGE